MTYELPARDQTGTAQIGLGYGADDFGSTIIEENVSPLPMSPPQGEGPGVGRNKFILNAEEFERLITDAGYEPRRRNTRYELLHANQ